MRGEPEPVQIAPALDWAAWLRYFASEWKAGDHIGIVGMTKSGKTTFARQIIGLRDFTVVFATKPRDDSLYRPLIRQGFELVEHWSPYDWEETGQRHVIFRPPLTGDHFDLRDALKAQADAFERALVEIFEAGGWCCYFDEVRYLSQTLGLQWVLDLLWLQGRSNSVTMVASTQRPVSVPINMFEQATWEVLYRISDKEDRGRAADFTGDLAPVVKATTTRLPKHEFLSVQKFEDVAVRSRVDLRRAL